MSLPFTGKQHKGAMRDYRSLKRVQAYERLLEHVQGTCKDPEHGRKTQHDFLLLDEKDLMIFACNETGCRQRWDPRKKGMPTSKCPWKPAPPDDDAKKPGGKLPAKKRKKGNNKRDKARHSKSAPNSNTRS